MEGEGFKVTLESLYTNKIKEISYEEEEAYQEKPTLSQKLTELAQRVDFSNKVGEEGSEPAAKKQAQRWPWDVANSKLRQALTEVSVLSDVIQIAQHQQKYVAMDPVMASFTGAASPAYQYLVKKKSLGLAAEILQKGTKSLSLSTTDKEKEFHKVLSSLRQRWRLKRIGSGAILGDLSYHSAGSNFKHSGSVFFDVTKSKPRDTEAGGPADSAADVINVTIPRDLRGKSEVLVFIAPQLVREAPPLSVCPSPLATSQLWRQQRRDLSPAELQLVAAQDVLFNQELFTRLAKEAYDKKPLLQHEVYTNRINIPLDLDCWLSVLYVREYDQPPASPPSSSSSLPPPRWELIAVLKQLLRDSHRRHASLVRPRPSTAGFQDQPQVRNAGVVPLKAGQLKQLEPQDNIFGKFVDKARHIYNEERLKQWLEELCRDSADPSLRVVWEPNPSFELTTAHLIVQDSLAQPDSQRCCVKVVLRVGEVTVSRFKECGEDLTFSLQRDKLISILKHQVVFHRTLLVSQLAEAEQKWRVVQQLPHPLLSPALARLPSYSESSSLLLHSTDCRRRLELLFHWNGLDVTSSTLRAAPPLGGGGVANMQQREQERWDSQRVSIEDVSGLTIRDKFTSLLVF